MEITKELFDEKAKEVIGELTEKSAVVGLTSAMILPLLKAKLFKKNEEETEEETEEEASKGHETHGFPYAMMKVLHEGMRAKRLGWNGKNQYIESSYVLYRSYRKNGESEYEPGGRVIVFHGGTSGVQVGWLASQGDMLADDWVVFK